MVNKEKKCARTTVVEISEEELAILYKYKRIWHKFKEFMINDYMCIYYEKEKMIKPYSQSQLIELQNMIAIENELFRWLRYMDNLDNKDEFIDLFRSLERASKR